MPDHRAELRRLAEKATEAFGPARVIREGESGRAPPFTTPPADRVMRLKVECACGHVAVLENKPASVIFRDLRCTLCNRICAPF